MAKRRDTNYDLRPVSTTPAEWAAAAAGTAIILGMIGFLTWHGIFHGNSYPEITITADRAEPIRNGFRVNFSARNHTGATASQVEIEGELRMGSGEVERSMATLDYLPGFSERRGGLFFRRDPGEGELTLRATGYQEP